MAYEDGAPVALPSACPWHGDGRACDVRRQGARSRKCGPGFALTVVRCRVHEVAFTLYPLGWTPYGRAPVAAAQDSETVFGSVLETAAARSLSSLSGYRRTRIRAIRRAALWLGVTGVHHEGVAEALGFDLAPHVARRSAYARGPTWHRRAKRVAEAHRAIASDRRLVRLVVAGFRSGWLGRPWSVEPTSGALVPLVSRSESGAIPPCAPRPDPSTTLPAFGADEGAIGGREL